MIAVVYFLIGLLVAVTVSRRFHDGAQWVFSAPIITLFWPLFLVMLLMQIAVLRSEKLRATR